MATETPAPAADTFVRYAVELRHDRGTVAISHPVPADEVTDDEQGARLAAALVCAAERAPERSVIAVGREEVDGTVRPILASAFGVTRLQRVAWSPSHGWADQ